MSYTLMNMPAMNHDAMAMKNRGPMTLYNASPRYVSMVKYAAPVVRDVMKIFPTKTTPPDT